MHRKWITSLILVLGVGAIGCGSDSTSAEAAFIAAARKCEVVGDGDYSPLGELNFKGSPPASYGNCILDCIREEGCDSIGAFVCTGEILDDCFDECDEERTIECDIEESAGTVNAFDICDGEDDCDDGEYEEDCPTF